MITLLFLSLFLLSILVIVLIIKLNWNSVISIFLFPFLLFNIGFSWYTVNELWGQPRNETPEQNSQVMYIGVSKPWIHILVKEETETIFYRIPYTKEMEKQVSKMQRELKKGQKIFIERKNDEKSHFEWYRWKHELSLPKNAK